MLTMNNYIGTVARIGGVPALYTQFVDSFIDMTQWNQQYICGPGEWIYYPKPPPCSVVDMSRNMIAERFEGEWLLQLDSDHSFDPDLLGRILNMAHLTGAMVITGMYQYKMAPHSPVLYQKIDDGRFPLVEWDRNATAMIVDSAGAGCLWVRRQVFDRIRDELHERPFTRYEELSEDHSFFQRIEKLGIQCVCATKVECHHLNVRPLTLADYDRDVIDAMQEVESKVFQGVNGCKR